MILWSPLVIPLQRDQGLLQVPGFLEDFSNTLNQYISPVSNNSKQETWLFMVHD